MVSYTFFTRLFEDGPRPQLLATRLLILQHHQQQQQSQQQYVVLASMLPGASATTTTASNGPMRVVLPIGTYASR